MKETITLQGRTFDGAELIAERYDVTRATVLAWLRRGRLPEPVRIGNRAFYDREVVESHLLGQGV
jgi:hypothetical protein